LPEAQCLLHPLCISVHYHPGLTESPYALLGDSCETAQYVASASLPVATLQLVVFEPSQDRILHFEIQKGHSLDSMTQPAVCLSGKQYMTPFSGFALSQILTVSCTHVSTPLQMISILAVLQQVADQSQEIFVFLVVSDTL
jgi:hypothetical protein